MVTVAAWVFVVFTLFTCAFQLTLVFGAPWGELTFGGRWPGVLRGPTRLIPLLSFVLLLGFAFVIGARAGLWPWAHGALPWLTWAVVGYAALGCIANVATPSAKERRLWLPVCAVMLASSAAVAFG